MFVVDDDAAMRDSLRWLLQAAELAVETYVTAEEFLDAYDHGRPGCLVLDVRLSGMSGLALQTRLAAHKSPLPIIFVSGYGDPPTVARALRAGALDFIEKPFSDEVLVGRIRAALATGRNARTK